MRKKILCLDVGSKIIGVAVSDAFGTMAFPRDEIRWGGSEAMLRAALKKFFAEEGRFDLLVLGKVRSDSHHTMVSASAVVKNIVQDFEIPLVFSDEHVSSQEAANRIADTEEETGVRFSQARRDSVAAQIILERYLASC